MPELNGAGFADFFRAVWGRPPFAWQSALADRVLSSDDAPWPEAIALPTAAGKTACMDIAIYALAAQAGRLGTGKPLTAPRRIFFVVDRRVIVDEAYERARVLAEKLCDARDGIVREVADRLRQLAGGDVPLTAHQLRGGMMRSDAWAKSPTQPAIIAATVDQVGSRLLFRAYGPGTGMRPVHAGLVGNDSLVLLDEAHCAQPFLETLQAVARYRTWADAPLPTPFQAVVMSATPPPNIRDVFRDESSQGGDPDHPLGRRQLAGKPTTLVVAEKAKGKKPEVVSEELAAKLVEVARELVKLWHTAQSKLPDLFSPNSAGQPAVVLFCNRVDTARRAHAILAKSDPNTTLLTGRMRPLDKDEIVAGALAELAVERSESRQFDRPRFIVATQTLEVGANLDFDLLVTECASLDALRQRFGRLNRMGRAIQARAAIVARVDQTEKSEDDPVYGAAYANTWQWLNGQVIGGEVDFGIAKLAPLLPEGAALAALNAPAANAPVLLPAHLDALAQTAPAPWPSPEVALFLHGPKSGLADVQVCWRADLAEDEEACGETLQLCPPASPECLAVPIGQMRRWLAGRPVQAGADVEGEVDVEDVPADEPPTRRVVRWRGRDQVEVVRDASALRPGDVLVIPADLKGWEELATLGTEPVPDWADRAWARLNGRARLRLHPRVLEQWPGTGPLTALATSAVNRLDDDLEGVLDDVQSALSNWAAGLEESRWSWLKSLAGHLAEDKKPRLVLHPTSGLILTGSRRYAGSASDAGHFSDEDDAASSGNFRSLLPQHLEGVAAFAARNARLCGLPAELVGVLEHAGRGHDLGKADPRFQAWLKGGNPWARGPLLAKSPDMAQSREESRKARERAGYPAGGRHELLSVRLLESVSDALPPDRDQRNLLLHLVESHHGHCRPFAPVVVDMTPVAVSVEGYSVNTTATGLERLDAGPAERYWRLTRLYGWWGLAWLEALLRLADHRRSEAEERDMTEDER